MEIWYCEKCSTRVPEADLESGRAALADGRIYCRECRTDARAPLAKRETVPLQKARRATRRARPVSKAPAPAAVVAVVAAIAGGGVLWLALGRRGAPGGAARAPGIAERPAEPRLAERPAEPRPVERRVEPRKETPARPAGEPSLPRDMWTPVGPRTPSPDKTAVSEYFAKLRADLEEKRERGEIPKDPSSIAPEEEPLRPGELAIGFKDGLSGWRQADDAGLGRKSSWRLRDGTLKEASDTRGDRKRRGPCYLYTGKKFTRFRASVWVYSGDNDVVGLRFGYAGADDFFQVRLWRQERKRILEERAAGAWRTLVSTSGTAYPGDRWFKLELAVRGSGVKVLVNDTQVLDCSAGFAAREGSFGLFVSGNELTRFRDVRVEPLGD